MIFKQIHFENARKLTVSLSIYRKTLQLAYQMQKLRFKFHSCKSDICNRRMKLHLAKQTDRRATVFNAQISRHTIMRIIKSNVANWLIQELISSWIRLRCEHIFRSHSYELKCMTMFLFIPHLFSACNRCQSDPPLDVWVVWTLYIHNHIQWMHKFWQEPRAAQMWTLAGNQ